MKVKRYRSQYKEIWDSFVINSKNGHFFFQRDYMEYHSDRFEDISLLIFNDKSKLISIFPANISGRTIHSHQGLTFGGFITDNDMKTETMLDLFDHLKIFCTKNNINKIIYKCTPYIYHLRPSSEDLYALFINNYNLIRRDVSSTICLSDRVKFQERRRSQAI